MAPEGLEVGGRQPGDQPRTRRRTSVVLYLLALLATLFGILTVGSLVAGVLSSPWWILAGAVTICVVVPLGVSLWLRRLAGEAHRAPRAVVVLMLLNLLALAVLGGLAGTTTRRALTVRGTWWVALVARSGDHETNTTIERHARTAIGWLASAAIPADDVADSHAPVPPGESKVHPAQHSSEELTQGAAGEPDNEPHAEETRSTKEETAPDAAPALDAWRSADDDSTGESSPGVTTMRFQRHGSAIVIPVRLHGPRLTRDVRMLFDTGATYSTIDSRTLADLGLYVTSSDPTVDLRTANGVARRTITVIEGASVGQARVANGLTVALCDACAEGDTVGLLGLNFTRHFRVTVDHAGGTLQLEPKQRPPSRLYDVRPFVRLTEIKGTQRAELLRISLWLQNLSPRPLRGVVLVARAGGDRPAQISGEVPEIAPGERQRVQFEGQAPASSDGFRVELQDATW